jgi:hypothetical protein
VVNQKILTNRLVRLACARHLDDLTAGAARGLRFDLQAAQHAIQFFGFLRHSKGEWAGQTFTPAPWQAFVVGSLFGWQRRWLAPVPHRLLRRAEEEWQEHAVRRHRPLPPGRRR